MKHIPQIEFPAKLKFHLEYILDHDEDVCHIVKQRKNLFTFRSEYLISTTKRLIFCMPNFSGTQFKLYEYTWENVKNCVKNKKIASTTLTVQLISSMDIITSYLPNAKAELLHNHIIEMIARE